MDDDAAVLAEVAPARADDAASGAARVLPSFRTIPRQRTGSDALDGLVSVGSLPLHDVRTGPRQLPERAPHQGHRECDGQGGVPRRGLHDRVDRRLLGTQGAQRYQRETRPRPLALAAWAQGGCGLRAFAGHATWALCALYTIMSSVDFEFPPPFLPAYFRQDTHLLTFRSVSYADRTADGDIGTKTCAGFPGLGGGSAEDLAADAQQMAEWGIDAFKVVRMRSARSCRTQRLVLTLVNTVDAFLRIGWVQRGGSRDEVNVPSTRPRTG